MGTMMSDFTIEQLEALKAGTTPGPWEWRVGERVAYRHELIGAGGTPILACGALRWPDESEEHLIAAAPDLVDALIAEKQAHQKLRAEIEEQRDVYAEDGESVGASQEEQLTFEAHRQVACDLTRILEVGNADQT